MTKKISTLDAGDFTDPTQFALSTISGIVPAATRAAEQFSALPAAQLTVTIDKGQRKRRVWRLREAARIKGRAVGVAATYRHCIVSCSSDSIASKRTSRCRPVLSVTIRKVVLLTRPPSVSETTARSDGVFDVPQSVASRTGDVTNRVGAVSKEWRWAMVDSKSLAVIIPVDQDPRDVSRERFVSLLEYCEEELGLDRVLAVFEKPRLSMSEGFPRTLRYVGFRLLPPDAVPDVLSNDKYFVMSYSV